MCGDHPYVTKILISTSMCQSLEWPCMFSEKKPYNQTRTYKIISQQNQTKKPMHLHQPIKEIQQYTCTTTTGRLLETYVYCITYLN